jgi:hypothetical protein
MIEGSGSVSLTNGTGSGRPKNNESYGSGPATLESRNVKNLKEIKFLQILLIAGIFSKI